jgi:hypothetical protein
MGSSRRPSRRRRRLVVSASVSPPSGGPRKRFPPSVPASPSPTYSYSNARRYFSCSIVYLFISIVIRLCLRIQ